MTDGFHSVCYDVVTLGETMVHLVPEGNRLAEANYLHVGVGGAESNTACFLAAAGHRVAWVSAVGDDPLGMRVLKEIASYGVDTAYVNINGHSPTGVYFKDPTPESTEVYYYRNESAASLLDMTTVHWPDPKKVRVHHHSGVTLALSEGCRNMVYEATVAAKEAKNIVSFDVNYRPRLWGIEDAAPVLLAHAALCDIVFVGLDEANILWGCQTPEEVRDLLSYPELVIKDGSIGATAFTDTGKYFVPAYRVEVVEPVGAGDAFAAGYLHAMLNAEAPECRLITGHTFARTALRSFNDIPPLNLMPTTL